MGKRRANMWWLDDWVRTSPELQLLWGVPGLQWSVSIKSEPRTEQRRTGLWATKVHWCTWGVKAGPCGPIQQTAIVVQIAKEVNDGSDRKVLEYTARCSLLRMGLQSSQGAHADPCPLPKAPTMGMWASELDHGAMEEESWVLPSIWILWHIPPTWTLLQTVYTLSWKQYSLMAVASFSRIMHRATKQKWFRNGLRSTATSLRCWVVLQIPQISIQSSICGICGTNKSDPWRPHLATYKT